MTLADRLLEVPDWLAREPKEAFDHFHTGAFVLQSLPAAVTCFLRSPDDPRGVILSAANCGHDTDTVASMAGNFASGRAIAPTPRPRQRQIRVFASGGRPRDRRGIQPDLRPSTR